MPATLPRFARFAIIGAAAVALNAILYFILVGLAGMSYLLATVIIFVIGNGFGFLANRTWTFERRDHTSRRLVRYYATMLGSLGLNLLSMAFLVDGIHLHYVLASAITSLWLAPLQYFAHGWLAFGEARRPRTGVMLATHFFANHGGGVELVAAHLTRRLRLSQPVRWFAAGPAVSSESTGIAQVPVICWNGIERRFGLPFPIPTPGAVRAIISGARSARLVWVHDLLYLTNFIAAMTALLSRTPLVVTVHIGAIPYRSRMLRSLMAMYLSLSYGIVLARAASVAFVSARVKREFEQRWSMREALLIPNGVDTEVFRPMLDAERRARRSALRLDRSQVVLFVGRFVERKGLPLMRDLATSMPSVLWVFAGWGPLNPADWSLRNVRVERGRMGADLADLYAAADLLVLPSLGEGFPLVVQEALAVGTPVLVDPSIVEGFPLVGKYVQSEPTAGQDAVQRWSARIEALLRNPSSPDETHKRTEFARRYWNWDRAALEYQGLIEKHLDFNSWE